MKRTLTFLALLAFAGAVAAADVVATIVVKYNGQAMFSQTSTFHSATDEQERLLKTSAQKTLDYASTRQNAESCKTCPYSIEWTWGTEPTVVTERHTYAGMNGIMRRAAKWLDDRVTASETNRQRGKGKPWG